MNGHGNSIVRVKFFPVHTCPCQVEILKVSHIILLLNFTQHPLNSLLNENYAVSFSGINSTNKMDMLHKMNSVCYDKVVEQVRRGEQVMVFVHARNETVRTATVLREMAKNKGDIALFLAEQDPKYGDAMKQVRQ